MNLRPRALLALAALAAPAAAHVPPPLPHRGPSPLLFVRLGGPPGLRVTLHQGRAPGRTLPAPATVGLRPGYCYRLQVSGLPGLPGVTLYPSVEVRNTLNLPPRMSAADYPAPLTFTEDDLTAAVEGNLVTKVVYLEHPDKADPVATQPGELLEATLPPSRDLVKEARERGRVMLVLRLGDGMATADDLAAQNVPGTILFPGEKSLSWPALPPCGPKSPHQFYDPILGPRPPEEECLHDGGDRGLRAGLDGEGRLRGLDPEDAVAEYTDARGRRSVVCSNRICVCVPRYVALRSELPPSLAEGVLGPGGLRGSKTQMRIDTLTPHLQARRTEGPAGLRSRLRPSETVNTKTPAVAIGLKVLQGQEIYMGPAEFLGRKGIETLTLQQRLELARQVQLARELSGSLHLAGTENIKGTAVIGRVVGGPEVVEASVQTRDLTVCCDHAPLPPDKPLVLIKCADRSAAQVGDVVTFTLRYTNHGGRPITDVAVSDSLSGRLEYVAGSAESDRDAVFTTQENEAGSLILRWEVGGTLLPGESGKVRFKARVR